MYAFPGERVMAPQSTADGSLRAGAERTSITLIGPGAAGKSTVGALLVERLAIPFVDLDQLFETRAGNISGYINRFGYDAYARENVATYNSLRHEGRSWCVAALSSGFMTLRALCAAGLSQTATLIAQLIRSADTTGSTPTRAPSAAIAFERGKLPAHERRVVESCRNLSW